MILLRANTELHQTFERLIEAMKVPVKWNGIFVVIDNYMILQGEVRSLFFHFDTRNVATNIIDIPVKEDEIGEVGTNMRVQNAINLILYAFGKWGTIKGVRVDKSFEQLNTLFTDIMKEMQVEPEYTPSYLRFYGAECGSPMRMLSRRRRKRSRHSRGMRKRPRADSGTRSSGNAPRRSSPGRTSR